MADDPYLIARDAIRLAAVGEKTAAAREVRSALSRVLLGIVDIGLGQRRDRIGLAVGVDVGDPDVARVVRLAAAREAGDSEAVVELLRGSLSIPALLDWASYPFRETKFWREQTYAPNDGDAFAYFEREDAFTSLPQRGGGWLRRFDPEVDWKV